MNKTMRLLAAGAALGSSLGLAHAASRQVDRGKYLVSVISCTDCHTPGTFLGHPDMTRFLGGSEVGFAVPGMGVFYGSNLTPDNETGLGKWSAEQIATAITTGKTPDGRTLGPPMPVVSFKNLTKSDALAIAAYLKTLKPVSNKVPGPFGPTQKPTSFVYEVVPADQYVVAPAPGTAPPTSATPMAPMPSMTPTSPPPAPANPQK